MGRKYGKNATTKNNVLKLVEVLLTLADEEEVTIPPDKLKVNLQVKWVTENQIEVSGTVQQKRGKRTKIVDKGITKEDLWTLAECLEKCLDLPKPKDKTKVDYGEQRKNAVQDVFDCLKHLGVFEDKRQVTNSRYWKFCLKLQNEYAGKDNLQVIEEAWQLKFGAEAEPDTPIPPPQTLDWRQICQNLLDEEAQRRQATGYGIGHEVNIYVPLGLVKPKQQPRREAANLEDAALGMQQYQLEKAEIEKRYEHEAFLQEVIGTKGKNLAIIGEPGAGKTTWLTQIACYLSKSDSITIWIPLANLGGLSLEEYLQEKWLKDALDNGLEPTKPQKQALAELFKSGKVWLLLDGVDEMKTVNSPLSEIQQSLRGWVNQARVVISCRLNVWEANPNALQEFDTYRTLCFDAEGVNEFIRQWFEAAEAVELGTQLQQQLAATEQMRLLDLVKNPLRLSLLCKSWKLNPNQLPTTQAMLYQQFRDDFYLWKQDEFPTSWSEQQELNTGLAKLALRAIDENLPLRKSLVYEVLGEAQFELAERLGWLNFVYRDVRTDEPIYAFFHLTFQEYFAACAINDKEGYWDYFLPRNHDANNLDFSHPYRIFEKRWREAILLWLGRGDVADEDKEEFIQALVNFEDGCQDFYGFRAYFLAAAGISEFKTCSLADAIVLNIVTWGFGYFNEEKQEWWTFLEPINNGARETLTQTDCQRAIEQLCHLLKNSHCSEFTRMEAAKSLEKIDPGNPEAIATLCDLAANAESESTR
ncbi:MAG: NACHT domain-containing protein, partial [Jaaginema sp. PMC 1079.18]|nr:NACHT domain-containing protein [Jaaginema sp. PMC 1079.18]MEC4868486.1 NACHT domain-containing protein [Jaaginema sp. PMC 1078.18]